MTGYGHEKSRISAALRYISMKFNQSQVLKTRFYVLPSSVHECMILPARLRDDAKSLQSMVEEINATQVSPDEVLADNVYRYSRKAGKLEIAA